MILLLLLQDPALESFERARRELEESFVERGPAALPDLERLDDPEVKRIAAKAAARIRELEPRIRKLIDDLRDADIDVREKATLELRRLGRSARWALLEAAASKDEEVKSRVRFLLLSVDTRNPSRTLRARLAKEMLRQIEERHRQGVASEQELQDAKLAWLHAAARAGEFEPAKYFEEKREILVSRARWQEKLHDSGITPKSDVVRAQLALAWVDVRLGKTSEEALFRLQRALENRVRDLLNTGLMSAADADRAILEALTDPDEDLNWRKP
jgi:hypothetical protein